MSYAEHDGRWVKPSQASEDIINQVLPEKLRKYFFFDGERIEEIVQDDKKAEMSDTTKILLGVKAIDRAIQHLGDAERELEQEYKKIASAEDANLIQAKQDLEDELQGLKERQDEIAKELDNHRELENQVDEQLRSSENVRELQTKRDEIDRDRDIDLIEEQVNNSKRKIKELISKKSYKVFLSKATINFRYILDELRERGELPSGIKQQFVKDLLQQQTCICGAKLVEGNPSYSILEKWLDKSGIGDIEETVIRMGAEVELIDKEIPILWENIDVEKIHQGQLIRKQSDLENQLADIHDRLKNSPLEDIRQLEQRREQIKKSIERLILEKGENKAKVETIAYEINRKNQLLISQKANEVRQKLALQRIKVTQETIKLLSRMREIKNKRFSVELEQAIQDIFGEISFKPYIPKLSNNYELTLVENTSGQPKNVAASSGENVILSLSFISSIISKVREWSQQQNSINLGNSTFPVVMDNPFSKLDTPYDKLVAKLVPRLADQLILITNKVQWRNEVEGDFNNVRSSD